MRQSIKAAIEKLRTTFHSDSDPLSLVKIWSEALSDLSDAQIESGTALTLKEHKGSWFPVPQEVRTWALSRPELKPKPSQVEWWLADDPAGGQPIAWHANLKDKDSAPIEKDPSLTWRQIGGRTLKRGIPVEQMLDPCPDCQTGKGVVDFRNGPPKGPRLAIKCKSCGWITARGEKMREAINLWNR